MMLLTLLSLISTPSWVDHPPLSTEMVYVVGEGESEHKDDALQKAWNSALIRLALVQFPELVQINSKSIETLKSAEFERTSIQNFQLISWKGLYELQSYNSPSAAFNAATKTYKVYRLLGWKKKDIELSRTEIDSSLHIAKSHLSEPIQTYKIPPAPEDQVKIEKQNASMTYIQKVSHNIEEQNARILQVLEALPCGAQVMHVTHVLGEPLFYEPKLNGYAFTWGTFRVYSDEEGVTYGHVTADQLVRTNITGYAANFGQGPGRILCNH